MPLPLYSVSRSALVIALLLPACKEEDVPEEFLTSTSTGSAEGTTSAEDTTAAPPATTGDEDEDTTAGPFATTGDPVGSDTIVECPCIPDFDPCDDVGLICDGCNCVACGVGEASPVDPIGDVTPEIIVLGTEQTVFVTGEAGACQDPLCVVEITNSLPVEVFYNTVNDQLTADYFLLPSEGMIPGSTTIILELNGGVCDLTGEFMDTIFFQDPIDFIEYGRVDITINSSIPSG